MASPGNQRCANCIGEISKHRTRKITPIFSCPPSTLYRNTVNDDITTTTVRQKKRNHFSFMNKYSNTQCSLTKFSPLIVNEYYRRCYLFNFGNLH